MEIRVDYVSKLQFTASTRGHQIQCDQPVESGGTDKGMSPPELLLASLGCCAGYYAAEYIRIHGLSAERLSVSVTAEKGTAPVRLTSFNISVNAPGVVGERDKEGVVRAIRRCLIHNTLAHTPEIAVSLVGADTAVSLLPAST